MVFGAGGGGRLVSEELRLRGVTYPTVRLRLDRLIQKISLADRREEEPFLTYIRSLAVDARIDLETAKDIMEHYRKEARESAQEKGERTE